MMGGRLLVSLRRLAFLYPPDDCLSRVPTLPSSYRLHHAISTRSDTILTNSLTHPSNDVTDDDDAWTIGLCLYWTL